MAQSDYYIINDMQRRLSSVEQRLRFANDDRQAHAVLLRQAVTLMEVIVKQHVALMDRLNRDKETN